MRRLAPLVALALILVAACARKGPRGGALYSASSSADPLGDHLARIRGELGSRGYELVGDPERGDIDAEGLRVFPADVGEGGCFAFIALGGPGIADLDLFLFDASMRQLGRDTKRDAHPWLVYCPQTAGRIVVRVQAYRGAGPYLYAVFSGPPGLGDISSVVSAGLLEAPPPGVDGNAAERIAATDVSQKQAGGIRAGTPITLRLARREIRPVPLQLVNGVCYAFASFGGEGVSDTDLFLLTPTGAEAVRDTHRARDAIVRVCASQSGTYQLQVKANHGEGQVYVVAYGRDATPVFGAAGDVSAEGGGGAGEGGYAGAVSEADQAFRGLDSDVRARGYEPVAEPVVGDVSAGEPLRFDLPLEAERCYAVAAATDPGGEIEVHLLTSQGDAIEAEVSAGAAAIVRACASGSGTHRIEVGLRRGSGAVVARAYRWPRATSGPFGLHGVPFVRLAEASSLLALEGYEPAGAPVSNDLEQGREVRHAVALEAQVCHAVVAVGGLGVDEIELVVGTRAAPVATDTSDGPIAIVRVCPPVPQGLAATIRVQRGGGRVLYQLFEGPAE